MWKVGLLGAGYIAVPHIKALNQLKEVCLVGICDLKMDKAKALVEALSFAQAYNSLDALLSHAAPDVVHVLTPPDEHFNACEKILLKKTHVFVEKPMALSSQNCQSLLHLAFLQDRTIGVNHNFLFYSSYLELKSLLAKKYLGKLDRVVVKWQRNLDQIRQGPFHLWMLRKPENLWLEIGPHLCAMILDLLGSDVTLRYCEMSDPFILPNQQVVYRRWTILGNSSYTDFEICLSLNPGFEEKAVEIRGQAGFCRVDFERNTCLFKRHTCHSQPFDLYKMNQKEAFSLLTQGRRFISTYVKSKFNYVPFGDPYAASIANSVAHFYKGLDQRDGGGRTGEFGKHVITLCEAVLSKLVFPATKPLSLRFQQEEKPSSEILIFGGTGFIGQALTRHLVHQGYPTRVLTRDIEKLSDLSLYKNLDLVSGDLLDEEALKKALKGIKFVFHLATARVKSWKDYLKQDVLVTKKIAEECLEAGVKRLIYTGTIDSYYAGNKNERIHEETPLDPKIHTRNYYAQAKAKGEEILKTLHREKQLPMVIVRPGIVLGSGGSPFHWGVGMWHYETSCQCWGKGDNALPFVLLQDVVQGLLLAMEVEGIEGESYNLIDKPCLSAREYIQALEEALEAKIDIFPTSPWRFFLLESLKWFIKVLVHHKERRFPSWRDWTSRTQRALFDSSKAISQLGWKPAGHKEKLIEEGIQKPAQVWWH